MTQVISASPQRPTSLRFIRFWFAGAITLFAAATILGSITPAEAIPRAVRSACKSDYKRICPRYRVGSSKMRSCMRSNVGQISSRCYQKLLDYGYADRNRSRSRRRRR